MDEYYNLGSHYRPITTSSPDAQKWFNRGLVWSYAFNHDESAECFRRAALADPDCAMAYWGVAYALGPNYNKPWEFFGDTELEDVLVRARQALEKAEGLASKATPVEQGLIRALRNRYPTVSGPEVVDSEAIEAANPVSDDDKKRWNKNYAAAMAELYAAFPLDLDVATLYVESLMNLTPWRLWDLQTGQPTPGAPTLQAKAILEDALSQDEFHPGALHLYIHLLEMSPHPEEALRLADNLRGLVPDAGHLNHMPSHIDVLVGDYRRAMEANTTAILADAKFVRRNGAMNFYTLYRCHDYHFRIYAAMFAGQSRVAVDTARELTETLPEDLLRVTSPPMADWLEGFLSVRVHVLVRFGFWEEILRLGFPEDRELYCVTTAMTHYAKGVAYAATGQIPAAITERDFLKEAMAKVPSSRTVFNNSCNDILEIALAMLQGEISYRQGDYEKGFAFLREAIHLDDALPYDEPWGWMQPTRHAYGALLLEQGRVEEAVEVYEADLGFSAALPRAQQHRGNVWSLHGYYEGLTRLKRTAEARIVKQMLELAVAGADVEIRASCACRTTYSDL